MNFIPQRHFIGYIVFIGVLCFFTTDLHAQLFQQGALKKEIMESQAPKQKVQKVKKKKSILDTSRKPKKLDPLPPVVPIKSPYDNMNATLVYLEKADEMTFDQMVKPGVQVLRGNVGFRQDDTFLYCDSAYFYQGLNSFDAFSNVRIVQGDTLFVYGDVLFYDGNTKLARLRHNVRMINKTTTLITDSLNYDRNINLAYYFNGGEIIDKENNLKSVQGEYAPNTNEAVFKTNVKLTNKNFTMDSDTLHYNTSTHIANIVGKTHIVHEEETNIYTDKGWYNTESEKSMLLNRSIMIDKDGKTLTGDTIFYDKKNKYGEAFKDVILNDTAQKRTLQGNYIYYKEENGNGIATDSALLTDWSEKDTMYMHADTLYTIKDSIYNVARAWTNVRFYRSDIQGMCDSLMFSSRDSIIHLYAQPVLWHQKNQLSGEYIRAFTKNKEVNKILIERSSMASEKVDSVYFNQISGKDLVAYVDSGALQKVEVNGNAETIYIPFDDLDSTMIGVNKTESSFVNMFFKNKKVDKIVLTSASKGVIYPVGQLKGEELYLKNFFWLENQRPMKREDVFLTFPKGVRPRFATEMPVSNQVPVIEKSKTDNQVLDLRR